jgi:hypothetical protein
MKVTLKIPVTYRFARPGMLVYLMLFYNLFIKVN